MIEIISSGSELLCGKENTSAPYICARLFDIGIHPSFITVVSDNKEDFPKVLETAFRRSSAIIITGGLGPTFDDITVETVATAAGAQLCQSSEVLENIKKYFLNRGITLEGRMLEINSRQANVIKGAKIINNTLGTAPGQMFHFEYLSKDPATGECGAKSRKTVFLFPGPPREMKPMFEATALPFFKSYQAQITKTLVFKICAMPESQVEQSLSPVMQALKANQTIKTEFAITAHGGIISFKVSVSSDNELIVDETLKNIKLEVEKILGRNIFGYNEDTLESTVGKLLTKLQKKVSVAESCTGGAVASRITSVAGASVYFGYGIVAYSNEAKQKILGVNENTLESYGAVSEETAAQMSEGVLNISASDYSIAVTGIAGPSGATKEKPVGLVYIAVSEKKKAKGSSSPKIETKISKNMFSGNRQDITERAIVTALNMLRQTLEGK